MSERSGIRFENVACEDHGLVEKCAEEAGIMRRFRRSTRGLLTVTILLLALTLPATSSLGQGGSGVSAFEIGADDFRMTWIGTDGNTSPSAYEPEMTYNSKENEFIVVFESSGAIFYRRVDAASGELIGATHVQVTTNLTASDQAPDVAYNSTDNEYLIVWRGTDSPNGTEIWGRRLNAATGAELDTWQFRISTMDTSGVNPSVAYNSTDNEYLVVWKGGMTGHGGSEVYGQRLNAATGAEVGTDDIRLSQMGPEGDNLYNIGNAADGDPDVAYNSTSNNYLVVWEADDDTGGLIDGEFEIYGQLVSAAGAEIGTDDLRLSDMYGTGSHFDAQQTSVAYNSGHNEYLVVWSSYEESPPAPPEASTSLEIWGQRVDGSNGAEVGTNDFNISDLTEPAGETRFADRPEVAYDPIGDRYLVVFRGDDADSGCADGEFEMHGQFLDGATATDILLNDFRFSTMGTDGETTLLVPMQKTLAYGSGENHWLVVWRSDNDEGSLVRGEWELYGQFLTSSLVDLFVADEPTLALPRSLLSPPGQ